MIHRRHAASPLEPPGHGSHVGHGTYPHYFAAQSGVEKIRTPTRSIIISLVFMLFGGSAKAAIKARNLKELASLIQHSTGVEAPIKQQTAQMLGFPGQTQAKRTEIAPELSTDGAEHTLNVVGPKGKPSDLVFCRTQLIVEEERKHLSGICVRSTPLGKFISALKAEGPLGDVAQTKLGAKDGSKVLKEEIEFHLKHSAMPHPQDNHR